MGNNVTFHGKRTKLMISIYSYAQFLSERLCRVGRYSTALGYVTAAKGFSLFMGTDDVPFSSVMPECLIRFEQELLGCNCRRNTVSMYMRMLRSVYNQAVMEGIAESFTGLFEQVFTDLRVTQSQTGNCYMLKSGRSVLIPVKCANQSDLGEQLADVSTGWTQGVFYYVTSSPYDWYIGSNTT